MKTNPVLPEGWQPFGEAGKVFRASGNRNAICVIATNHFTGARRECPVVSGSKLYRVTGRVRGHLKGTTRAHVGIDYLDKDGRFIRQATTPMPLRDHLRWGLHNFGGKSNWSHFVAHSYDVPENAATLS